MHNTIESQGRGKAGIREAAAPRQDLREWLAALQAAGQVTEIRGAEREEEIGGIVDIYQRTPKSPAVLFDDIPGYPSGYRVLANILTSVPRINLTLGLDANASEIDLVQFWRNYMKQAKVIPPRRVAIQEQPGPQLE